MSNFAFRNKVEVLSKTKNCQCAVGFSVYCSKVNSLVADIAEKFKYMIMYYDQLSSAVSPRIAGLNTIQFKIPIQPLT